MSEQKKVSKSIVEGKGNLGAVMNEDRIEELAQREYANQKIGGPKTEEGKKKSLRNLRPGQSSIDMSRIPDIENLPNRDKLPVSYLSLDKVLNDDEQGYYVMKWAEYTDEFEMNTSADEALLHVAIMEEIVYNRLYRAQLSTPHEDLSKQMSESIKRHNDALKSLGISRGQRLGAKSGKEDNIASLIQAMDKDKLLEDSKNKEHMLSEEEELMKEKRLQFAKEVEEIQSIDTPEKDKKEEVFRPPSTRKELEKQAPKKSRKASILDVAALR